MSHLGRGFCYYHGDDGCTIHVSIVCQSLPPVAPPPTGYSSQLPPPPPPNFPSTEYAHISQRPLPPVPGYEGEGYARNSIVSVSPSEMSLASHQSSESSRSLSPPIGPSYSPGQSRTHLEAVREKEPPMDLQAALVNRLRQRSHSTEKDPSECVVVLYYVDHVFITC